MCSLCSWTLYSDVYIMKCCPATYSAKFITNTYIFMSWNFKYTSRKARLRMLSIVQYVKQLFYFTLTIYGAVFNQYHFPCFIFSQILTEGMHSTHFPHSGLSAFSEISLHWLSAGLINISESFSEYIFNFDGSYCRIEENNFWKKRQRKLHQLEIWHFLCQKMAVGSRRQKNRELESPCSSKSLCTLQSVAYDIFSRKIWV